MKYIIHGTVTVSCWTEVQANSQKEAEQIAKGRDVAGLAYQAFDSDRDESWHFSNDGTPQIITEGGA